VSLEVVFYQHSLLAGADMKSRIHDWRSPCAVAVVLLNISTLGCGGSTATVTGQVVYDQDGAPMTTGMMMFMSVEGQHLARGDIQSDGRFRLRSAVRDAVIEPGKYGACIVPPDTASQRENGIVTPPLVDARFLDTQTSGLQFDVQPGANDFTVTVSKPAGG
jgi:hypothetical protein